MSCSAPSGHSRLERSLVLNITQNCLQKLLQDVPQPAGKFSANWAVKPREVTVTELRTHLTSIPPPHPRAQTQTHTQRRVRVGLRQLTSGESQIQDCRAYRSCEVEVPSLGLMGCEQMGVLGLVKPLKSCSGPICFIPTSKNLPETIYF